MIAKFPQSNFGDDIKISEIKLGAIVNTIFMNFKKYFHSFKDSAEADMDKIDSTLHKKKMLIFPELDYWLNSWEELLAKDGGGVLLFTFDYYHIMILSLIHI